jgi:hypothetical protein
VSGRLFHEEIGGPTECVVGVLVLSGRQVFGWIHEPIRNGIGVEITVYGNKGKVAVPLGVVARRAVAASGVATVGSLTVWAGC